MPMTTEPLTEGQLAQEFNRRAKAVKLTVDCLGSGRPDSEICIIGEAPGEQEARMKMPMVGGSGQLLWTTLKRFEITRPMCYVTNVSKREVQLSTKKNAKIPIPAPELEHWEGLLDWELDQLPNLKYVLILGGIALHALTGEHGITNWRGSVFDCTVGKLKRTVKVICTNNPAAIMRMMKLETMFNFDIAKLRRVMDGKFKKHIIRATINPSYKEAIEYLDYIEQDDRPIAFDIETIAMETACVGFANNAHEGICINWRDMATNRYDIQHERLLRRRIQRLFYNPQKKFIAQNGSFDAGFLGFKDRINVPKIWFDTLLAHHTLYPLLPHNLGYLTAQYTDHPYYKDEGTLWREGGNISQFWEYNVKDCCITWAACNRLEAELKAQDMSDFFYNHVMRLQPHLIHMQKTGILTDQTLIGEIADGLKEDLAELLSDFHKQVRRLTGDETFEGNPRSPKQMAKLFFDELKLIGRGKSTGKENRDRVKLHPGTSEEASNMLTTYEEYITEAKFFSTYVNASLDRDGRYRCEYKQYGVTKAPGRLSSAAPLWGTGGNLQNQPVRAYPMFVADDGYMFSYFDLKQAEAKVVAYLWRVRKLIENFERAALDDNFDIHRGNAAAIFREPYDEIPTSDYNEDGTRSKRYLGKKCVHGLNYRMQPPRLAETCKIPLLQARSAWSSYHHAFPEIQQAWIDIIKGIKKDRVMFSPVGRRMIFLGRIDDGDLDSVVAFGPQSTIGDKVSGCISDCMEHPDWPRQYARMILNIHDALISIHTEDQGVKESVQGIMKECAHQPIPIRGENITIFTDFKESVPWSWDKTDPSNHIKIEDGIHRWSTLQEV